MDELQHVLPTPVPPWQPITITGSMLYLGAPLTIVLEGIPFTKRGRLRMVWEILRGRSPRVAPSFSIIGNIFQYAGQPAIETKYADPRL